MEPARSKQKPAEKEGSPRRSSRAQNAVASRSRWPAMLNDAHSPALRLGHSLHTSLPYALQAKLTVNEPADQYEQEANRVADQVMHMPEPGLRLQRKCGCGGSTSSGGSCDECTSNQLSVQRRANSNADQSKASTGIMPDVLRSTGQALDEHARSFFEERFRQDFSNVRVHNDERASESAREVNARAYTVGRDIVFGAGEYAPGTTAGRSLLAHELTHTIQQSATSVKNAGPGRSSHDSTTAPHHGSTAPQSSVGRHTRASPVVAPQLTQLRIQRQPVTTGTGGAQPCTTRHPENCLLFEQWLGAFGALPSFPGRFIDPRGRSRDAQQVIGERAPTTIPNPAPAPLRGNTEGIERPWAGWLRNNLPPTLIETAYELPTDCADIVLILRHVWLNAHGRTEQVSSWRLGRGVSREAISETTADVTTGTLKQGMIGFYRDANGDPIRSLASLLPLLHPGDVLIWERRDARGRRSGGHSETIETISFNPTVIATLQGNQPLASMPDDELGSARGWRIERGDVAPGDLRDVNNVWTWADGEHVLIGAGPWGGTQQARSRPPAARRGTTARVLRDWSTSLSSATTAGLSGVLEGALGEARAALEGQRTVPEVEARQVGEQIGRRLWTLAHQAADLGVASHFEPLQGLLSVIEAYRGATRPTGTSTRSVIDAMYNQMREALELGARGASSLNFSAPTGRAAGSSGTRRVNILLTGFDPFEPGGSLTQPDRELWNTSGAAAMALDGETIQAGGRVVAAVESIVLPVDYRSFATGMVEAIARPLLPSLDAVMTVSMDSSLTGQAALERYAVNFHHVDTPIPASGSTPRIESGPIPLPPVTGGGVAPAAGPAILPSWNQLDALAASVQSPSGGIGFFARSSPLALRFDTGPLAQNAMQDMGLASATEHRVSGRDVVFCADSGQMTPNQRSNCEAASINRLLGVAQTPPGQPANRLRWPAFQTPNTNFEADVRSGPGGSFLSNEVSYRMLRLLQQQGSAVASFHTHTPDAPNVPVAERTNRRSAARSAAMSVRSSVIAGLRALVSRVARLLRP